MSGVFLHSSNDRAVISGNTFFGGTSGDGQWWGLQAHGAAVVVVGNTVSDHAGGIDVSTTVGEVSGNVVYNNSSIGLQVSMNGAGMVRENIVYNNGTGLSVAGGGNEGWTRVEGNRVYGNQSEGLAVHGRVEARGNEVYGQYQAQARGMTVNGALAEGNVVHGNYHGILVTGAGVARENRVYNNSGIGLWLEHTGRGEGNTIYSNETGLRVRGVTHSLTELVVSNNLVYGNTNNGVVVVAANGARVVNNTVYQAVGDAVRVEGNSRGTVLRNNILWTGTGYALYVSGDSQTGFDSDYNLFYTDPNPNALVGYWNNAAQSSFANWTSASGQDAFSLFGNPQFIDMNGADNVFGYSQATAYDGGPDDNFQLSRNSPAIDRGHSWQAPRFDRDNFERLDDPGVSNGGSQDYRYEVGAGGGGNAAVGIAQNWRGDDYVWQLNLPFMFPFFGIEYDVVFVSSNGYLHFGPGDPWSPEATLSNFARHVRIAVLWDDLRTDTPGSDIYVDTSVANQARIGWVATSKKDGAPVEALVTLWQDGRIRFEYGSGNANLSPRVGLSLGTGLMHLVAGYDGAANLNNAGSVMFSFSPGYTDIGAHEFQGSSFDTVPPRLVSTNPAELMSGSTVPIRTNHLELHFNEALNPVSARSLDAYRLEEAGPDGVFGTADDRFMELVSAAYVPGSLTVRLNFASDLLDGFYRLTVYGGTGHALVDVSGNVLDGNGDGAAGGNWIRTFRINAPPFVTGAELNRGESHRSQVEEISIAFSEDVGASLSPSDFVLTNLSTGAVIPAAHLSISYDPGAYRASLRFPGYPGGILPEGEYELFIEAEEVLDNSGLAMLQPFVFSFTVLQGDATGDGITNELDLYYLWQNLLKPAVLRDLAYDLDGDGQVTMADLLLVKENYLRAISQPEPVFMQPARGEIAALSDPADAAEPPVPASVELSLVPIGPDNVSLAVANLKARISKPEVSLPDNSEPENDSESGGVIPHTPDPGRGLPFAVSSGEFAAWFEAMLSRAVLDPWLDRPLYDLQFPQADADENAELKMRLKPLKPIRFGPLIKL